MIHAVEKFVDLIEPDPGKKLEVSEFKKYFQLYWHEVSFIKWL